MFLFGGGRVLSVFDVGSMLNQNIMIRVFSSQEKHTLNFRVSLDGFDQSFFLKLIFFVFYRSNFYI